MKIAYKGCLYEAITGHVIMFHGTSSNNIQSIIDNGMLPNNKKNYDNHDNTSLYSSSTRSLSGSYWTMNPNTASFGAGKSVEKVGGNRSIVIATLDSSGLLGDEDNYNSIVSEAVIDLCSMIGLPTTSEHSILYLTGYASVNGYVDIGRTYGDIIATKITEDKTKKRPYPLFQELLKAVLERKFAHIDPYYENLYKNIVSTYYFEKNNEKIEYSSIKFPKLDKNTVEDNYLDVMEKLTEYYPEYSLREENYGFANGRSKNIIGFDGSSKITAIITLKKWHGGEYIVNYGAVSDEVRDILWKKASIGPEVSELTSNTDEVH